MSPALAGRSFTTEPPGKLLYNHHSYLILKYFLSSLKQILSPRTVTSISPTSQPLTSMNLLFVSVDLPILDITYIWNHIVCVLLQPTSLIYHHVLLVHPCCGTFQNCIHFYD